MKKLLSSFTGKETIGLSNLLKYTKPDKTVTGPDTLVYALFGCFTVRWVGPRAWHAR